MYRCMMEWHYGTDGPVFHVNPDGRTARQGFHGVQTTNANLICDECAAEWRANYPGYPPPDGNYWLSQLIARAT